MKEDSYMKKWIIIAIIFIILLGIVLGIYVSNKNNTNEYTAKRQSGEETINEITNNIKIVSTSSVEEKTSPNAIIIFETYYKECKHTTKQTQDIPIQLVNKTQKELEESYKDWKIKAYNINEIKLYKEVDDICQEHYILKENNGYISIYIIDKYGKEILKETTGIVTKYLPQEDLINLKEGIKVIGDEELNATIEDYE